MFIFIGASRDVIFVFFSRLQASHSVKIGTNLKNDPAKTVDVDLDHGILEVQMLLMTFLPVQMDWWVDRWCGSESRDRDQHLTI